MKTKKTYSQPTISDLGDVAKLTQGTQNNNGFDANSSMGMMAGSN